MSNKYKILLAAVYSLASVFCFAKASDCPGTANYVYCRIASDGIGWLTLAIILVPMAICTVASVNVSGSNKNEN